MTTIPVSHRFQAEVEGQCRRPRFEECLTAKNLAGEDDRFRTFYMDRERGILYGVVALQAALVDPGHFSEFLRASEDWDEERDGPLAEMLVAKGWIRPSDRAHLDYLVQRKLEQHAGDAKAGLASVTLEMERSRASLQDEKIARSLSASKESRNSLPSTPSGDSVSNARDRYALNSLHATGGIGRVWLAHDAQMGREVALKELRPEQADNRVLRARFLREAQVTGQLEHPGIVPVYEMAFRPETGQPFYTMRFVKGRTLSDAAKLFHQTRAEGRADSLEFQLLLNAFVTVCKTVAYAHSRGVIHRDLKGQNVVVGDFGEVVVLDWGLAKLVRPDVDPYCGPVVVSERGLAKGSDQTDGEAPTPPPVSAVQDAIGKVDLTMHGDMLGTPAYMAPEQVAGHVDLIDRRTDVYGLGAILYQLLTGKPPFTGANVKELLGKVESEEPVPPQQFWSEIPPSLQTACLRALAKKPSDRFASANELAQEVERWQEVQRKKAEDALRVSQALYHSLVESIPLWVWRKDLDSRFTFVSKGLSEGLGVNGEDMIGKTDHDFFPVALADKIKRDDIQVINTGETLRLTEERAPDDKGPRFVEVIKIPVRDSKGDVVGTQGVLWDLTEWKRTQEALRESESLYQSLMECSSLNVWRKDLEGRFTFANKGFCESMALAREDLIGKTDFEVSLFAGLADKYRREDLQVIETGQQLRILEDRWLPTGKRVVLEVIKIPIRDARGGIIGTQGVFWDVAAWKGAQDEGPPGEEPPE